ncbi:uncharacterized protein BJX67DRAFT_8477 [Aspergillus lucknowensis]|uniref:Secreted protein n=1 Tax=Aspergillus lucknowensis TaxID=176173 RepID=A0ABR4M796_9EURO
MHHMSMFHATVLVLHMVWLQDSDGKRPRPQKLEYRLKLREQGICYRDLVVQLSLIGGSIIAGGSRERPCTGQLLSAKTLPRGLFPKNV